MPRGEDSCIIGPDLSARDSVSHYRSPSKVLRTLLAVSPFLAILSAPTTREKRQVMLTLSAWSHTDGVDLMMLEQRSDHAIADHDGRDTKRYEFQGSKSVSIPSAIIH